MKPERYYVQGEKFDDGRFYFVVDRRCGCPYQSVFNHEHMVGNPSKNRKMIERHAAKLELADQGAKRPIDE